MDHFIIGGIGRPVNDLRSLLSLLLNFRNQRRKLVCPLYTARSIDKKLRGESRSEVLIQHGTHPGRELQTREKIFVQPAPADHI